MLVFQGDNNLINPWLTSGINDINVDPYDRGYFIVPASGDSTNINSTSTTFPGSTNQTTFINSTLKNGTPTGKSLIGIAYGADSVITFSYVNNTPTITILPPTNITTTTATLNGNVTGSGITSKGFEYRVLGTTNFTQQAVTNNPLQLTLNNLLVNTTYEYRIYVTTSYGTIYSQIEIFSTDCGLIINPPFTENFDASFTCWNQTSSDNNIFTVVTYGASPSCTPHSGTKMLRYNSFGIYANNWAALFTPKINFNSNNSYSVNFWIYRTNATYSNQQEGIEIYISSTQSLNSATLIGFISNDRTATPSMSSDGWYNFSCSLPSSTTGNNYLIFKAISGYGYNIYIDDISITQTAITTPTISYNSTTNITHNSATFNASYTQGAQTISSKGFKYKSQNDANWTTLQNLSTTSPFNANVNNLNPNTTYYVKSYITTQTNTYESAIDTFTTLPLISPTVTTNLATNISYNSVILNGTIIAGNEVIFYQGFEYKLSNSSIWTTLTANLNGNVINYNLSGLNQNSTYEYRAYATTASGTVFGTTQNFTTLSITPPTVVTNPTTNVTDYSLTLNGTIIAGSETITSQGFEYKLVTSSTWTTIAADLNGNSITYNLSGLLHSSTYEYRAFATTASGTVYGTIESFTTPVIVPPTIVTNAATPTSGTTATLSGTITAGTESILAQGFEWKQTNASQWEEVSAILNGDAITFDLTNLIPEQSYQFKARATTASGVTYGLTETFTTLGLIEVERKEISITIYPNPTNSKSKLKIENVSGNIMIRITDVSGRVLQKIEENVNNGYETQIDLSNYSKGVYFINITTDKSQRTEKLILK